MAWLEVHQTLRDHWKTLEAADLLEINPVHMMGHLISLWLWALDNTPDGNLIGKKPKTIARAAQWDGDANIFLTALIEAQWLDESSDALLIHDWYDYAGKLMEQRKAERNRSRNRRHRANKQPDDHSATDKQPSDDRQTTAGQPTNNRRTTSKRPPVDRQTTAGRPPDDQQTTVGTVPYPTLQYQTQHYSTNKLPPIVPYGDEGVAEQQGENLMVETAGGTGSEKPADQSMTLVEQRFVEFWSAYPKKAGKGAAERSWGKIKPSAELHKAILAVLEDAKKCEQWQREDGRFIPYPATWLNQKRWEDEYIPTANTGHSHQIGQNRALDTLGVLYSMMDEEDECYNQE